MTRWLIASSHTRDSNHRPAASADNVIVAELAASEFRNNCRPAWGSAPQVDDFIAATMSPQSILQELQEGSAWYELGIVDGRPAGFIKLERSLPPECVGCEPSLEVSKLNVLPQFQGGEIAHVLLRFGLEYAKQLRLARIWICVWDQSPSALAFYQGWGFRNVGERQFEWNGIRLQGRVMTRSVESASPIAESCKRIDLPFLSDDEIAALVTRFEGCTWPYDRWTHRAHLAVGLSYARSMTFDEALQRMRHHLALYNQTCGDPTGYNETVTILFLRKIIAAACQSGEWRSLHVVVDELVQTCTIDWLYTYYSKDRIWSQDARQAWLEPDRRPLDF